MTESQAISRKLNIDTQVTEFVLTRFLHEEITKAGFGRAVLGLSGGIDSALACYLAVAALGAENVLALHLPYQTSAPERPNHATLVIEALGVQSETVDISGMVDAIVEASPGISANRKGNVMHARV